MGVDGNGKRVREIQSDSHINQTVSSDSASIKELEMQLGHISAKLNTRPKRGLPSDSMTNPKNNALISAMVTRSSQTLGEKAIYLCYNHIKI